MLSRLACVLVLLAGVCAQQQSATRATSAPQGYRIAGTVVNSLTGQAVPLASVAIARTTQGTERDISKSISTGTDGRFAFAGLSRGKYSLMATGRGYSLQYYDHHDPYATAIAVGPNLDSEHLVFRLQPDASIEGVVSDENNDPVQNALVRVFQSTIEGGQQKTIPVTQAQTDDQGHYRAGHLSVGTYYLVVSARPWYAQNIHPRHPSRSDADARSAQDAAALDVTYPLTFYPDAVDWSAAAPIVLTPGERQTAEVVVRAVPSLHLRIHTGGSESNVLGRMVFPHISQRIFEGYLDSVYNAPDSWAAPGIIEISGLAPGHYVVEMSPSSGLNEKSSGRAWYREIDLTGDADLNASDGPSFNNVSGFLVFEDTSRLPSEASIQLSNPETGEIFRSDINSKGEFDFQSDDVRPGRYLLALENARGFFIKKLTATGAKVTGSTIEITGTGSVRIGGSASRGAALVEGTVVRDGEPFSGAMVVLVPQDPVNNSPLFRRDQSDSDGTFTLADVVPGQYTAIAIANGWDLEWAKPSVLQPYLKHGESVQIPANGQLDIKVQLQ